MSELDQDEEGEIYALEMISLEVFPRLEFEQVTTKVVTRINNTNAIEETKHNVKRKPTVPLAKKPNVPPAKRKPNVPPSQDVNPLDLKNIDAKSDIVCLLYLKYLKYELNKNPLQMRNFSKKENLKIGHVLNTHDQLKKQLMEGEIELDHYKGTILFSEIQIVFLQIPLLIRLIVSV